MKHPGINGCFRWFVWFALVVSCAGLFEDQIGKFDWRQQYVGKIVHGAFDTTSVDRIIVATESNVLAALSAKTGEILWRQILESGTRGEVKLLQVTNPSATGARLSRGSVGHDVITVTGSLPALVRGWNSNSGTLEWEWSLLPAVAEEAALDAVWFENDGLLYHVVPVWGSHLEVTPYQAVSGQQARAMTSRIAASWTAKERCTLAGTFFVCASKEQLLALDLVSDSSSSILSKPLGSEAIGRPRPVRGEAAVIQNGRYYSLRSDQKLVFGPKDAALVDRTVHGEEPILLQGTVDRVNGRLIINAHRLRDFVRFDAIELSVDYSETLGDPELIGVRCKQSTPGSSSSRSAVGLVCRILLSAEDGAIVLIQQGKIKWVREEALAEVSTADFLDLTLSDAEGAIEEELNNKNGDVFGALQRRIASQALHVKNVFLQILGIGPAPSKAQRAGLVRDDFGLHKMLIVVTASGKVFGIDNVSGKHHWIRYLPTFAGFANGQPMKLLVQRTSRFYPLPAQCVVLGRDRTVAQNGLLYIFNPITGQPISGGGVIELPYRVQQVALLHETGPDFLKGLLLLDYNNQAHVVPESLAPQADNFHLFTANHKTAQMGGFLVQYREVPGSSKGELITTPSWQIDLSGGSKRQQIVACEGKSPIEHVHSQGRVMADRSVLYKYINPNLVAVATHGLDSIHRFIMNVHLVDVVSGSIVFSMSHKRVRPPLHMVHSENWLVYSYYNEKARRTEITSIELYEGKTQTNSTVWSSLDAPPLPMVERQSYILPMAVASLKETITEKGITSKHILIGLSTGAVAEMSWALLDPRRPVTSPEKAREEGIIPYMPELPLPHEILINYNQTVANIRGMHTAPSGLESTCLVLVHGLDLFVTRVSPSKTFDLLKEDFDYFLITIVLIVLTSTSCVVKQLASKKIVKQAWK